MKLTRVMALALLGASTAPVPAAEPLGRLFFTPDRRLALEQGRNSPAVSTTPTETGTNMSLDGIVRRSHGPATVWINGRAQIAGQGAGTSIQIESSGAGARIGGSEDVAPASISVGQRINRVTQEKVDLLPSGAITRAASRAK